MVLLELPHEQSWTWTLLNYFNKKSIIKYGVPCIPPDAGCSLAITPEFLKIDDLMVLAVSVGVPGFDHLHYMSFQPEQDIKRLLMPNGSGILMGGIISTISGMKTEEQK